MANFTKIAGSLLLDVRELVNWGIAEGHTTPEQMRLTIAARAETAKKLIKSGLSQREAARLLGVGVATINRDVSHDGTKSVPKRNTAATNKPATRARRAAIAENAAAAGVTVLPTDKYRIVYADPAWDYGVHAQPDYHTEQRDHYPVMELEKICALPVKDWVENDAVLFLWVTSPILQKSFQVIDAWGFEYKTSFVWDKIKHNM